MWIAGYLPKHAQQIWQTEKDLRYRGVGGGEGHLHIIYYIISYYITLIILYHFPGLPTSHRVLCLLAGIFYSEDLELSNLSSRHLWK